MRRHEKTVINYRQNKASDFFSFLRLKPENSNQMSEFFEMLILNVIFFDIISRCKVNLFDVVFGGEFGHIDEPIRDQNHRVVETRRGRQIFGLRSRKKTRLSFLLF